MVSDGVELTRKAYERLRAAKVDWREIARRIAGMTRPLENWVALDVAVAGRNAEQIAKALNRLQCRLSYESRTYAHIRHWIKQWMPAVPDADLPLVEAEQTDLIALAVAYEALGWAPELRQGSRVGATAASKFLHALRAELAPPWDITMRRATGLRSGAVGYLAYARQMREVLRLLGNPDSQDGVNWGGWEQHTPLRRLDQYVYAVGRGDTSAIA